MPNDELNSKFWEKFKKRIGKYTRYYSDSNFWKKLGKRAKKAGSAILEPALTLHHAAQDDDTPAWAKRTMLGALGYFILPADLILDITPVAGYADDLGVLVAATAVVAAHIKDEHKQKARETFDRLFGGDPDSTEDTDDKGDSFNGGDSAR